MANKYAVWNNKRQYCIGVYSPPEKSEETNQKSGDLKMEEQERGEDKVVTWTEDSWQFASCVNKDACWLHYQHDHLDGNVSLIAIHDVMSLQDGRMSFLITNMVPWPWNRLLSANNPISLSLQTWLFLGTRKTVPICYSNTKWNKCGPVLRLTLHNVGNVVNHCLLYSQWAAA